MTHSYNDSQDNFLLDDSFDAKDESLLLSPDPKFATEFQSNPANEANVSMNSDSSVSFSQTPVKPKFSYASCMDALDSLVPSAMKAKSAAKRRATMFSMEHSSARKSLCDGGRLDDSLEYSTLGDNDCSFVAESNNVCFSAGHRENAEERIETEHNQSIGNQNQFAEEIINEDTVDESNRKIVVLGTNGTSDLNASEANEYEGSESCNESSHNIELVENTEQNAALVEGDYYGDTNNHIEPCETLEFPICIRNVEDDDNNNLESKLGSPANESFDGCMPEKIDTESSMEIDHDVVGTIMDEKDRVLDKPDTFIVNCNQSSEANVDVVADTAPCDGGTICLVNAECLLEHEQTDALDDSSKSNAFQSGAADNQNCNKGDNDLCGKESIEEDDCDGADIHHNLQTEAAPPMGQVTTLNTENDRAFNLNPFEYETVNSTNDRAEDITPPYFSAFSGTCLSPIAKSSSPHNCDGNESNTDQLIVLKDTTTSRESAPTYLESNNESQYEDQLGTRFDTLSQSEQEHSDSVAHEYINQNDATELQDYFTLENASLPKESLSSSVSPVTPSDANQPDADAPKNKSLGDLASVQDASNALLQKLRASAETRKREVTRCRYSLERKAQLLTDEKESRSSITTVAKSQPVARPRNTMVPTNPKKKFEGLDPYKPFAAKPMASAKNEGSSKRKSSISLSTPKSAALPDRKKLAPGEDPYKPFKARPMPNMPPQLQNSSTGTNRKVSAALRPHHEQNHSIKAAATANAKPPTRLLSGCDASKSKENSSQERIEEEKEKLRRKSVFKARQIPKSSSSTVIRLKGEKLPDIIGKENDASTDKRISSIRPFTPHSTSRARDRAAYDNERAQRENTAKIDRKKKRQGEVDKLKEDIDLLKNCIR